MTSNCGKTFPLPATCLYSAIKSVNDDMLASKSSTVMPSTFKLPFFYTTSQTAIVNPSKLMQNLCYYSMLILNTDVQLVELNIIQLSTLLDSRKRIMLNMFLHRDQMTFTFLMEFQHPLNHKLVPNLK
uniref:Uncharacterized protein n=1 Tax=Strigamia maritima TaxID=126957 RepID=T1JLC9_STRMM